MRVIRTLIYWRVKYWLGRRKRNNRKNSKLVIGGGKKWNAWKQDFRLPNRIIVAR
jgi:hypothetical protein